MLIWIRTWIRLQKPSYPDFQELKRLTGFKAVVEGDSQLTILWGSFTGEYPWHFADWVEEIWPLSASLSFSFQHVFRDSNFLADALARTGASRTDLAFDV